MLSTLLLAAVLVAAPQAALAGDRLPELKRFGTLAATCDNGGRCTVATESGSLIIIREPGPAGAVTIRDEIGGWTRSRTRWIIDDRVVHEAQGSLRRGGAVALALLAELRRARTIIAASSRSPIDPANLNAALDWIEARGRRARPLPVIRAPELPATEPPRPSESLMRPAIAAAGCERHPRFDPEIGATLLDARSWLVTARRCAGGEIRSVALLVRDGRIAPMRFDVAPSGLTPQGTLNNADSSYGTRLVTVTGSGAGQTSCRDIRRYQWDGRRFRLVHAAAAGRCYGARSITWLDRWRTEVRETPAR